MMEQVYHLFQSQKSESLHQQITRLAPKDKHFSGTMALSDRVSLVVITDSVGYESGMLLVFDELGMKLPTMTIQYLKRRSEKRDYDKRYCSRPDRKNLWYSTKKENIRKELQRKAEEVASGLGYGPSMYVDELMETDAEQPLDDENPPPTNTTRTVVEGNRENDPSVTAEASPTVMKPNKPRIPRSKQKCKDCPLYRHKTMRSAMCKEHEKYLQLQQQQ